jgi:hypothetical protein
VIPKICPKCGMPQHWVLWRHCPCGYDFGPPSPGQLPKKAARAPFLRPSLLDVLPFLLLFIVLFAYWTGWGAQIGYLVPGRLGTIAWKNSLTGVGITFVVCSVLRLRHTHDPQIRVQCAFIGALGGWLIFLAVKYRLP